MKILYSHEPWDNDSRTCSYKNCESAAHYTIDRLCDHERHETWGYHELPTCPDHVVSIIGNGLSIGLDRTMISPVGVRHHG